MLGIVLLMIGNYISQLPWTLAFLLLHHVGIRMFVVKNPDHCRMIQKRLSDRFSHTTSDGKGFGYAVGRWFVLFLDNTDNEDGESPRAHVITTPTTLSALINDDRKRQQPTEEDSTVIDESQSIRVFDRSGSYFHIYYRSREVEMTLPDPRPSQEDIMARITNAYNKKGSCVAYIHGSSGAGKTLIGLMLAKRLNASYYNHFRPWEPGETIHLVYCEMEPQKDRPLILAMDEIDEAVRIIMSDSPPSHKRMPIAVGCKAGWNRMMDEIHLGLFPHIILLLTSNIHIDCINSIDSSLLRPGRVDVVAGMACKRD